MSRFFYGHKRSTDPFRSARKSSHVAVPPVRHSTSFQITEAIKSMRDRTRVRPRAPEEVTDCRRMPIEQLTQSDRWKHAGRDGLRKAGQSRMEFCTGFSV